MSEPSFASLNPALLARKGGAKPAMRRQFGAGSAAAAAAPQNDADLEDLGWNDMGAEHAPEQEADVVEISPDAAPAEAKTASPARKQQEEIAKRIEKPAASKPKKSKRKSAPKQGTKQGKRAAFTLRLDADRHLKLRLAATIQGVSAQNFVTQALDAQLAEIEELETLAASIKRK
ncbi:MAG: toxin-antitoxin system HicB family antitoxin [Erythrobacter sp.]